MSSVFPCIDAKKSNNGFTLPRLSRSSSSPSSLAYISKRRGFKADHQRFLLECSYTVRLVPIWPSTIGTSRLPLVHRSFFRGHHYEYHQYLAIGLTRSYCIPRYYQHFHSSTALIISSSSNSSVSPNIYSNRKGLKADPATISFFLAARRRSDLSKYLSLRCPRRCP